MISRNSPLIPFQRDLWNVWLTFCVFSPEEEAQIKKENEWAEDR